MRIGKVKESILKRSVLRPLHHRDTVRPPAAGEDAGVLFVPELSKEAGVTLRVHPVEGWTLAPQRTVYGAVNSLIAARAVPKAISITILMPEETQEPQLKALMKELDRLCAQEGIVLLSGHTAVSPYVETLIIAVTALGIRREIEMPSKLSPGLDLVVAGTVGREGAAMIATEQADRLKSRYAPSYIETAKHFFEDGSMKRAAEILQKEKPEAVHAIREGGVFAGLWEMAAAGKVGLAVDLKSIPIRQHTIEVCEFFNLNPYMLRSGGTFLLACHNGPHMVHAFHKAGITAAVVGETTEGNDRVIRYDEEIRFLEPPKTDEYYKTIKNSWRKNDAS